MSLFKMAKMAYRALKALNGLSERMSQFAGDPKAAIEGGLNQAKEAFGQFGGLGNVSSAQMQQCANKANEVAGHLQKQDFSKAFNSVMGEGGLMSLAKSAITQALGPQAGAAAPSDAQTSAPPIQAPKSSPAANKNDDKEGKKLGDKEDKKQIENEKCVRKAQKNVDEAKDAIAVYNSLFALFMAKSAETNDRILQTIKSLAQAAVGMDDSKKNAQSISPSVSPTVNASPTPQPEDKKNNEENAIVASTASAEQPHKTQEPQQQQTQEQTQHGLN